jgi:hypothetical protein
MNIAVIIRHRTRHSSHTVGGGTDAGISGWLIVRASSRGALAIELAVRDSVRTRPLPLTDSRGDSSDPRGARSSGAAAPAAQAASCASNSAKGEALRVPEEGPRAEASGIGGIGSMGLAGPSALATSGRLPASAGWGRVVGVRGV